MGWVFSLALFVAGCMKSSEMMLVASGLFAIAGSIGLGSSVINSAIRRRGDGRE